MVDICAKKFLRKHQTVYFIKINNTSKGKKEGKKNLTRGQILELIWDKYTSFDRIIKLK